MGVVECLNHNLVEPYNVLYEKDGRPPPSLPLQSLICLLSLLLLR